MLVLTRCRLPGREAPADIVIEDGRIAAIGDAARVPAERLDAGGRLVTPGLVEAHIHLDKALLHDRIAEGAETVADAIRLTGEAKRRFTREDIQARARRVLDAALAAGTTAMRSHVEVDPVVGLMGMEAILPLRAEYAPAIDLQVCAFAQEGIVQAPGTETLLRRALEMGADLVGGCPYNDADPFEHIRIVFALARAFDVDVDFHLDFDDEPRHQHIRAVVEATLEAGWQGRVAVGHMSELAALPPAEREAVVARLARAGIGVIVLPATDLYLMGRRAKSNPPRGLAPVRELLAAGVPVALATNNVRNPFTTVGTADLTHMAFLGAVAAHMGTPAALRDLFDALTVHPARILRLRDYGLAPGCRADLVVWNCERVEDVAAALPDRALVLRHGRVTVEQQRTVRARWREGR
ncbi:MAG TPA: amidohydrolase family protein [Candidatus Binatia bacterium]|nr:amidohydrolase family protein [Candidatus Binatia bacterium]